MCLDCDYSGYREVQLQDGILRDYCECDVGQDLKEIVASEDFEYQDKMFTDVEGTVADIRLTGAKKCVATLVITLIVVLIIAVFM